jgi:hypothetical protein
LDQCTHQQSRHPAQKLALQFSCNNLHPIKHQVIKNKIKILDNLEIATFAVLFRRFPVNADKVQRELYQTVKIGQTEIIYKELHPEFTATIGVDYEFLDNSVYVAEVYNVVDSDILDNLAKQHLVLRYEFTLHKLVMSGD